MIYDFSFLENKDKNLKELLEKAFSVSDYDYKQSIIQSIRCVEMIVNNILIIEKLDKEIKLNIQDKVELLKKKQFIEEKIYIGLKYLIDIESKAKSVDCIISNEEIKSTLNKVYDLTKWFINECDKKDDELAFIDSRWVSIKKNLKHAKNSIDIGNYKDTHTKCRIIAETMIKKILEDHNVKYDKNLSNSISKAKKYIGEQKYKDFDWIRANGNPGAHSEDENATVVEKVEVNYDTATQIYNLTIYVVKWFNSNYKYGTRKPTVGKPINNTPQQNKPTVGKPINNTPQQNKPTVGKPTNNTSQQNENQADKYEGKFKDGKKHGYGRMVYANGDIYEGYWNNGKKQGRGRMVYNEGYSYEGQWSNDKKNGTGTIIYKSGIICIGEWLKDNPIGEFNINYPNKDKYMGEFKDGKRHGTGIMNYINGDVYKGQWNNNKKHGTGIMNYNNGDIYEGPWNNNKIHGIGKLIKSNGEVIHAEWKNGNLHRKLSIIEIIKRKIGM